MKTPFVKSVVATAALCLVSLACSGGDSAPAELSDALAAMTETGIECDGEITPYEAPESVADLGVEPLRTFKCTVDGTEVQGTEYASATDREQAIETSSTLICSVDGALFSYVAHEAWMVTAEDPTALISDLDMLDQVADATSSDVTAIECPEGHESIHDTNQSPSPTTAAP